MRRPRTLVSVSSTPKFEPGQPLFLAPSGAEAERGVRAIIETGGSAFVSYLTPAGIYMLEAAITRAGATSLALDLPSDVDDRTNRFTPFDGHVIDVGGGGLALAADVIAPQHATVVVSLAIPDDRPVVVTGSVLASDRDPNQRTRRLLRIQFSLIGEADRDRLLRWVFANLRRQAKEGA